jgi:hypothetical protein
VTGPKILTDPIILMSAFRYALGRASYIVGWVADELIAHRDALRPDWRQDTVREIRQAFGGDAAGWGIDAVTWQRVVTAFLAIPTACRSCALTEAACWRWPPPCCGTCNHTSTEEAQ